MRRLALLLLFAATPAFAQTPPPATPTQPPPSQAQPGGRAAHLRAKLRERFEAANTTHDGRLTLGQAQAAHMPLLVKNFAAIDQGQKGYVTEDDLRAFIRQRIAARRTRREQEQAPPQGG